MDQSSKADWDRIWWIMQGGSKTGPFTTEEVRGQIRAESVVQDTPVWRQGDADWSKAGEFADG